MLGARQPVASRAALHHVSQHRSHCPGQNTNRSSCGHEEGGIFFTPSSPGAPALVSACRFTSNSSGFLLEACVRFLELL